MFFKIDSLEFNLFLNICLIFVKIKKKVMRKILAVFILLFSVFYFSQEPNNRFSDEQEAEASAKHYDPTANPRSDVSIGPAAGDHTYDNITTDAEGDNPPNPEAPVPIDNYLPILLLVGVSIIIFYTRRRNEVSS